MFTNTYTATLPQNVILHTLWMRTWISLGSSYLVHYFSSHYDKIANINNVKENQLFWEFWLMFSKGSVHAGWKGMANGAALSAAVEDCLASCLVTEQEIENTGLTPKWICHWKSCPYCPTLSDWPCVPTYHLQKQLPQQESKSDSNGYL